MNSNWPFVFSAILAHEGGYVNHTADPGGATNKGITQRTYNAYLAAKGQGPRNVKMIADAEVSEIYRTQYWNAVRGDDLPAGLDWTVADFAVNSGPAKAAKTLQRALGVTVDGVIGVHTLAAVRKRDVAGLVREVNDSRLAFLKRLKHWPTFGRGWSRRVAEVRAGSLQMASGIAHIQPGPPDNPSPGRGDPQSWSLLQAIIQFIQRLFTKG